MSRPFLENSVRRRLVRLPNICLWQRVDVEEPLFDRDQGRVVGVRMRAQNGADGVQAMTADLVVDATGCGSCCVAWLSALGYPPRRLHRLCGASVVAAQRPLQPNKGS